MPGVMIIEAFGADGGHSRIRHYRHRPERHDAFLFCGHRQRALQKTRRAGDQLLLSAKLERSFKGIWRFSTVAMVGENEVAHADMMVAPEVSK